VKYRLREALEFLRAQLSETSQPIKTKGE
jgi:hypothetical protein